jgi:hypothetical protein
MGSVSHQLPLLVEQLTPTLSVQNGTVSRLQLFYCGRMKKKELSPKQLFSIPCPTCGVAAGIGCVLHSGAPRSSPHIDRKFSAMDAIERKQIRAEIDFDSYAYTK